jgi:hypothetical protein
MRAAFEMKRLRGKLIVEDTTVCGLKLKLCGLRNLTWKTQPLWDKVVRGGCDDTAVAT